MAGEVKGIEMNIKITRNYSNLKGLSFNTKLSNHFKGSNSIRER